jgi:D-alanyl-D-alanine carboxypeptidase
MKIIQHKFLALSLIISLSFIPAPANAGLNSPRVAAKSAVIIDYYSGKILYAKQKDYCRYPASTVKLLTAMTALDNAVTSKRCTVSRKAALAPASKLFLRQGETYSVDDLVKAIIISSANDAAVCLAEGIGGTELNFASLMNQKAWAIGCRRSHFSNASGLPDPNQVTSAYNMALITRAAFQYPLIRKYMKSKYETIRRPSGGMIKLKNHNKLLWNYPIEVYGKTGFTRSAGWCFACVAQYGTRRVVVVMFKSAAKWNDVRTLVTSGLGYSPATASKATKVYANRKALSKAQVLKVQKALKKAGCNPGSIDGIFGSRTLDAVMQFQKKHGLSCDGIVGPQTMGKLKTYM